MISKRIFLGFEITILQLLLWSCESNDFTTYYLNQPPPREIPVRFAPDILSIERNFRDAVFTPDGKQFYFTEIVDGSFQIMFCEFKNSHWTSPSVAPFSGLFNDFEPCIIQDGSKFFFGSMRPSANKKDMTNDVDIWVMQKTDQGWSEPELMPDPINTNCMEYYPSFTNMGTMYFGRNDSAMTRGDIHFSRLANSKYSNPKKLPAHINLPASSFNAFIASDESYLIFSTYLQEGANWHSDMFISFSDDDGTWSEPRNFGTQINSSGNDHAPWVSHDGKYLFFSSTRLDSSGKNENHDIFWVNAKVIEKSRSLGQY